MVTQKKEQINNLCKALKLTRYYSVKTREGRAAGR
jgi:hypothetical protein